MSVNYDSRLWSALCDVAEADGTECDNDTDMVEKVIPVIVQKLQDLRAKKVQNVDRTCDMLTSDLLALRAEIGKPIKAISLIHKLLVGKTAQGAHYEEALIFSRIEDACLWALLGDDDYLTDDADRRALLGPDAAGPASVSPTPS